MIELPPNGLVAGPWLMFDVPPKGLDVKVLGVFETESFELKLAPNGFEVDALVENGLDDELEGLPKELETEPVVLELKPPPPPNGDTFENCEKLWP